MMAMCDSPLAGHSGYLYEYEAPQVTGLLSREVFRIHGLLEYIDGDRDSIFSGAVWQEQNIVTITELIPSTWLPSDVGIPKTWLILTMMVISLAQQ
jgi:hypothetical protein